MILIQIHQQQQQKRINYIFNEFVNLNLRKRIYAKVKYIPNQLCMFGKVYKDMHLVSIF